MSSFIVLLLVLKKKERKKKMPKRMSKTEDWGRARTT